MIFKCKMCGGDITKIEGTNTGKCNYCKSTMTLPDSDSEKIINLYNRANFLRMENDFDKAKEMYESILELDNKQLEAHWGILLCKYGVEYIDDPKTKKKIPTCHRTEDKSILNDSSYKLIKKEAYGTALELYETEARIIDEIQKGILEISKKEKPYDVFICYKETDEHGERTQDSVLAEDIYDKLKEQGLKIFFARITLENKLGKEYEPYIYSALKTAKVMLVVGASEENFKAVWVKNEWSRYLDFMKKDKSKSLIPVYSKVDAYKLPEEFVMLQAQSMDKIGAMQDLVRGVKKLVEEYNPNSEEIEESSSDARSIGNGKYEVTIFKEKLPTWYYVLVISLTFIILFCILLVYANSSSLSKFMYSFWDSYFKTFNKIIAYFQVSVSGLSVIFGIMKIKSRNTYSKSLYGYYLLLILEALIAIICLTRAMIVSILWFIIVICLIILYIINPSWHLDSSSKLIVNREEKEKIQINNKKVRTNFETKTKYAIKLKYFILGIIISIMIYALVGYSVLFANHSNKLNENEYQVKIIYDYINIRNKTSATGSNSIIGHAKKNEIYTVLDIEYNDKKEIWYYIETSNRIKGYIRSDGTEVISGIEKKRKIRITTDYINVRQNIGANYEKIGEVKKGEVYEVLDETKKWYKIQLSDGTIGYVAGLSGYVEDFFE